MKKFLMAFMAAVCGLQVGKVKAEAEAEAEFEVEVEGGICGEQRKRTVPSM